MAVLGPGAIGGLIASVLARDGHRVVVIGRHPTIGDIGSSGLKVESRKFGSFSAQVDAQETLSRSVDVGVIAVKAPDLRAAAKRLGLSIEAGVPMVTFLNGFEHVALLRQWYPGAHVVAASIRAEVSRRGSETIVHTSPFAAIRIADGPTPSAAVDQFIASLRRGGFDVSRAASESLVLWEKLAFLAPLALLTTLSGENLGAARTEHVEELEAMAREVCMVAGATGAVVDPEVVIRMLHAAPASMESSMQRDARAGRPMELDAIGGAILRSAEKQRLEVPVLRSVVATLTAREGGTA